MVDNNPNEPSNEVVSDFYFVIIPDWVLALPVSSNAIRTYAALRRFADNNTGECFPSRRLLAMKARLSVSTLDRALAELVENHAILVQPRKNAKGDWTSNLYTVLTFPKGVSPPARTPLFTRDGTRLITRGEGTISNRTKSNNRREYSQEAIDRDQGASAGAAIAMTGGTRDEVLDLSRTHSEAFIEAALEAFDARRPKTHPTAKQQARDPEWQDKFN